MKVKLTQNFQYSPDGRETITVKAGNILEGDPAKWAMNQKKAERINEKAKKPPQNKAKKLKETK